MNQKKLRAFLKENKINLNHFRVVYLCPTIKVKEKELIVDEFEIKFKRIKTEDEEE